MILFKGAREIVNGEALIADADIAVKHGVVLEIGSRLNRKYPQAKIIDCTNRVLTPGFVDSHTHAVFAGTRAAEYEMRAQGLDYMEIARRGGGINASVRDVRTRSEEELVELARPRLRDAILHGTTTIEIKSGYGLDLENELKLLRVIRRLQAESPLDIVPTFLGAHDVPSEYRDRRPDYVDLVCNEMIPAVAAANLAVFCDVFMEPGAFTAEESRRILTAGQQHGLIPKLHADEFANSAAAELAVEMGAASADHLGAISEAGISAMAASTTVATLLPATLFFLGKKAYAPVRTLIQRGVRVALATDFNPGTAPSPSMPLVLTMACSQMQMTPAEAIEAATAGGARALLRDDVGVLRPGSKADILVWQVTDHREIPYHFGKPPLAEVWKGGARIV